MFNTLFSRLRIESDSGVFYVHKHKLVSHNLYVALHVQCIQVGDIAHMQHINILHFTLRTYIAYMICHFFLQSCANIWSTKICNQIFYSQYLTNFPCICTYAKMLYY